MSRSDSQRLDDMREMCSQIAELVARGKDAFEADFALQLALERALEVLGEAANNVSSGTQGSYPDIPWRDITRLRIRLAHHYHRILPDLLWTMAADEVPMVAKSLGPIQTGNDQ